METTFKNHMTRFLAKEAESLTGNDPVKKILVLAAVGLASFITCFAAGYYRKIYGHLLLNPIIHALWKQLHNPIRTPPRNRTA